MRGETENTGKCDLFIFRAEFYRKKKELRGEEERRGSKQINRERKR